MMGYGMGGFGALAVLFWIVVFIDLVLVGIWLFKQVVNKK